MKRLLLIAPNFFNYPKEISEELKNMGFEVTYYDDRPSTNALVKAIIRVKKELINIYIQQYFYNMLNFIKDMQYDVVFLISGQSLSFSEDMILKIKNNQPSAKFVLYQWDSQKNFPYIKKIQKYFDKCYSFDKEDTNNTQVNFLPLFYSNRYEHIGKSKILNFKYDVCFVGTAHPKKYKYISIMTKQLKKVYSNQYIYYYYPSRMVFFYRKLFNKELKKAHYREFHFTALDETKMDKLIKNSRCILDSAQEGQTGLTIRVIEALGAKRKLITTNQDIKNYDFYREENIYLYSGYFDYSSSFFKTPYRELPQDIYEKYSIKNWLKEILQ